MSYSAPLPPPPSPRESAGYIPWWLLALVAAVFIVSALALAALVIITRPAGLPQPTATAAIIVLPPPATSAVETATFQAPPTVPGPDPTVTAPPPPPGEVGVGAYVQVVGTGDAGFLNLRAEPSLQSSVNYLAIENEVFQVQAGPTSANDFTWWFLVDPATNTKFGWAVQNYLQVVQGP